jgi:hypothetical protein
LYAVLVGSAFRQLLNRFVYRRLNLGFDLGIGGGFSVSALFKA